LISKSVFDNTSKKPLAYTVVFLSLLFSPSSYAGWSSKCSAASSVVAWPNAGDQYGTRFYLKENPANCNGFWIPQNSNNKQSVQSIFLTAISTGLNVCVQYDESHTKYNGSCKLNSVRLSAKN